MLFEGNSNNNKPKEFFINPDLNDTVWDKDGNINWIHRYNRNSGSA